MTKNRVFATLLLCLLVLVGLAWPARAALAAPSREYYKKLGEGDKLLNRGDISAACTAYEEAVKIEPSEAKGLGALANCYEKSGENLRARKYYRLYRESPSPNKKKSPAQIDDHLRKVEAKLGEITVTLSPGQVVRLDGEVLPGSATYLVEPGRHTVDSSAPDHEPWETVVDGIGAGERRSVTVPALSPIFTIAIKVRDAHLVKGLVIRRDGQTVESSWYGKPQRVRPGTHRISAEARGRRSWETTVDVGPDAPRVWVEVPLLDELPAPPPKAYTLTIYLADGDTSGLMVTRDSIPIGDFRAGAPLSVPSGQHTIQIRSPGKQPWSTVVTVDDDEPNKVITAPPLEDVPNPGRGARVTGGVFLSLGIAGLISSVATGVMANTKHNQSQGHCSLVTSYCDPTGYDAETQAARFANATTGLIIAGLGSTALGIILVRAAPSADRPPSEAARRPVVRVGWGSISLTGEF